MKNEYSVRAEIGNLEILNQALEDFLFEQNVPAGLQMKIMLAFEELFVNVCNYAYEEGDGNVEVLFDVDQEGIAITLIDSGRPFNPLEQQDPDTKASASERKIGGLGIFLVKQYMDHMDYEYSDQKNKVRIVKYLDKGKTKVHE